MTQANIIALIVLAITLGAAAAVLEKVILRLAQLEFGVEPGVRNPEGRRRFQAFRRCCWQVWVFGSAAYSLQEFKEPPYSWLADFSEVVTPAQWLLALLAVAFVWAAVNRYRDRFVY